MGKPTRDSTIKWTGVAASLQVYKKKMIFCEYNSGVISAIGCESAFITETEVIHETWLGASLRYSSNIIIMKRRQQTKESCIEEIIGINHENKYLLVLQIFEKLILVPFIFYVNGVIEIFHHQKCFS